MNKIADLNELNPRAVQECAIQYFVKSDLPNKYFLSQFLNLDDKDFHEKNRWANLAEIIIIRGYPACKDVIKELFIWLQDLNWPGTFDMIDFLLTIPTKDLKEPFYASYKEAIQTNDETWIEYLADFAKKKGIAVE